MNELTLTKAGTALSHVREVLGPATGLNSMTFKALNDGQGVLSNAIPVGCYRDLMLVTQHVFTGGAADGVFKITAQGLAYDGTTVIFPSTDLVTAIPLGVAAASKAEFFTFFGQGANHIISAGTIGITSLMARLCPFMKFTLQVTTATTSTTSVVSLNVYQAQR